MRLLWKRWRSWGSSPERPLEEALRRAMRQVRQRQALKEPGGIGWEDDLDAMRDGGAMESGCTLAKQRGGDAGQAASPPRRLLSIQ
jgi:hypothetical protein